MEGSGEGVLTVGMETTRPGSGDEARSGVGRPGPSHPVADGLDVPRVLLEIGDRRAARGLVCVGGAHGNEPAGVLALQRIARQLEADADGLDGWFLGLAGNLQALRNRRRFLRNDLNRAWTPVRLERVRAGGAHLDAEDRELAEMDRELEAVLEDRRDLETAFVDLHTTSGPGPAWIVLDDALRNRQFALGFPMPVVLGLEEQISGTFTFHLTSRERVAIGVETGQHDDPRSVERAVATLWLALESSGVLRPGVRPEVEAARQLLEGESRELPAVVEVRHRHPIGTEGFRMMPGFVNFQRVAESELLAATDEGEVRAPFPGLILMPLYQAQGDDGFFLVRAVERFWLRASAAVRRLHLERVAHWLPGVERHPEVAGAFLVDRRTARWLALELFHLLGFRRLSEDGPVMTMVRRVG